MKEYNNNQKKKHLKRNTITYNELRKIQQNFQIKKRHLWSKLRTTIFRGDFFSGRRDEDYSDFVKVLVDRLQLGQHLRAVHLAGLVLCQVKL